LYLFEILGILIYWGFQNNSNLFVEFEDNYGYDVLKLLVFYISLSDRKNTDLNIYQFQKLVYILKLFSRFVPLLTQNLKYNLFLEKDEKENIRSYNKIHINNDFYIFNVKSQNKNIFSILLSLYNSKKMKVEIGNLL
jgi:hypothetical protein